MSASAGLACVHYSVIGAISFSDDAMAVCDGFLLDGFV